jgi:lipoprotein-anchoring transpeptidase ErfK/SrfK
VRRGLAAAATTAAVLLVAAGCGGGDSKKHAVKFVQPHAVSPPPYTGFWAARILQRTQVRTRPGGRVVATVGRRTEWRSPRYYAVRKTVGDWVGVMTAERPNNHVAWVPRRNVELVQAPASIHVSLSRRELTVHRGGRVVMSFTVAVGQPDTPTPLGRFSVTDALKPDRGSPYGCCILALSARQPHIAQGWTGGDRVAIHATPAIQSIGTAASNGCMRATDADMRRLFKTVTLGATVIVRD